MGTALRPCLRQATFLLWAVGAVQVAGSVRSRDEVLVVLSEEGPEARQAGLQER